MRALYLFSLSLRIVSVTVWLGGMSFLFLVFLPVTRRSELRSDASRLAHLVGVRLRRIGWIWCCWS